MTDSIKLEENVHYELTPVEDNKNNQAWNVRLLETFPETVISFGNVAFNPDDETLHFNFSVVSSPDPDLNEDRIDLQDYAALILEQILEDAVKEDSLVTKTHDAD